MVIAPQQTPKLKSLTFGQFDNTFWAHLDAICGDPSRPLEIRFVSMYLGDDSDDEYDEDEDENEDDEENEERVRAETPDAYDILKDHPLLNITGLFLPVPAKRDLVTALESLRGCGLQRFGLDISQQWKRWRDGPSVLPAICSVISSMPDLNAFCTVVWCRDEIRLGPLSWRTSRSDEGVDAVPLNEMEDLERCPEFFRTRQFGVASLITDGPPHRRYWDILS